MHKSILYPETRYERVTRLLGLYLFAPLLLLAALPMAVHISQKPYVGMAVRQMVVFSVEQQSPADHAGLRSGDLIVAINGQPTPDTEDLFLATASDYALEPRSYSVERQGEALIATLVPIRPPRAHMVWGYSLWTAGLAFLMIGWWVLAQRHDPVARNFFGFCMIFAFFLIDIPDIPWRSYIQSKEIARAFLQLVWPVMFLRFFLLFPSTGRPAVEDLRRLRLLMLPVLPLFVLSLVTPSAGHGSSGSFLVSAVQGILFVYFVTYFIAGLVIFARKALRRDRRIQHTKLRVILIGLLFGLTPFLVAALLGSVSPGSGPVQWQYLGFSLLLVPATFGLAIMRYGALDTAFVVRSSLIYGLSTLLVLLSYLMVVGVMGHYLTSSFGVSTYPLVIVIVAASSLVILPLRRTVQRWIDHAFYPARRANRAAVAQLGHDLTGQIDQDGVTRLLLSRLEYLYRPQRLAMLLTDDSESTDQHRIVADTLRHDSGAGQNHRGHEHHDLGNEQTPRRDGESGEAGLNAEDAPIILPASSSLTVFLDQVRRPVFTEEFEDVLAADAADTASIQLLSQLESELLMPLVTGNRLIGFISFGPKSSGALYSQEDLANLRALAIQAASSLESRRLYAESLARRQLETELTVAKEIQAQLLPTAPLSVAGLDLCGRHQPCRKVGGDYFDYFPLDEETIGFCIADVAGKGIPAALLMTTLRVTFRGEAVADVPPETVVQRLNEAVSDLLSPGQFICFFYGTYRLHDRLLSFCNAGMDPPLLFRAGTPVIEKLKKGGPVLGVQLEHIYRRGTLTLRNGDIVLLYTDGITEERNAEGEFFDLDRLIDLVQNSAHEGIAAAVDVSPDSAPATGKFLPMAQLLDQIFSTVEDFGGPERSDDKTVMLLSTRPLDR